MTETMKLRRVTIPNYRALRDVELSFDASYEPQVFPLGSENGGGKSTLLQFVFILLHCAWNEKRRGYLQNMLASYQHAPGEDICTIAKFEIEADGLPFELTFSSLNIGFVDRAVSEPHPGGFEVFEAMKELNRVARATLDKRDAMMNTGERRALDKRYEEAKSTHERLSQRRDQIVHVISANELRFVTTFKAADGIDRGLVYHMKSEDDVDKDKIPCSIFLFGPSLQQYLFLRAEARKGRADSYLKSVLGADERLPGLTVYDWLSETPMINLFSAARNSDFAEAVETGEYGNSYATILKDVNNLLSGKRVRPLPDLSAIRFSLDTPNDEVDIGLEDLSQGELKRLMLYAWLRAIESKEAVVLIDELEASFHPDWQATIISDILTWAPQHQYIIATHSYEICQAVTPSHVRELEPKLLRK